MCISFNTFAEILIFANTNFQRNYIIIKWLALHNSSTFPAFTNMSGAFAFIYPSHTLVTFLYTIYLSVHLLSSSSSRENSFSKKKSHDAQSSDVSCFQPRPRRKIAAPRCRRWTHSQGPWTIHRYPDQSNSYPARWKPSRGGTSSRHLSSHLPRIRDRPQLAAAHGDPFQGKEVAPLCTFKNFFIARHASRSPWKWHKLNFEKVCIQKCIYIYKYISVYTYIYVYIHIHIYVVLSIIIMY